MKIYSTIFCFCALCSFVSSSYSKMSVKNSSNLGKSVDEFKLYEETPKKERTDSLIESISKKRNKNFSNKISGAKFNKVLIIAKINDEVITNIDIINAIRFVFFSCGKKFNQKDAKIMLKSVLNSMIEDKLRFGYAKMAKIEILEKDIDKKIEEIARSNKLTVPQMEIEFEKLGINIEIFKKNLKSKMLMEIIGSSYAQTLNISKIDFDNEKAKLLSDMNTQRWKLCEILFKFGDEKTKIEARKNAEGVLELLKEGFDFQVLAQTLSQSENIAKNDWIRYSEISSQILSKVKNLSIGEYSGVIETKTGYKIVSLLDKAEKGKSGKEESSYQAVLTQLSYNKNSQDPTYIQRINGIVEELLRSNNLDNFNKTAASFDLKTQEKLISVEDPYFMELVARSKKSNSPAILPDQQNEEILNILLFVCDKVPNATLPDNKEIANKVMAKKINEDLKRYFKKMESISTFVLINEKKLGEIL